MKRRMLVFAVCGLVLAARADEAAVKVVTETPGLVALWMFGEPTGTPHLSTGTKESHALTEVGGPVARVEGGPFSGYSADFNGHQYFKIPHADLGDLNICGTDARVSMFAVVRIVNLAKSRTIAGIWSEGKGGE